MTTAERPIWHPSKWFPVFVGGRPGEAGARLVGFTMETIPTNVTTRFTLTSAVAGGVDGEFEMHGDMVAYPYRHEDGRLYWAWQLERHEDLPHVPDFRPAAMH
jgi:hypothetical protein